MRKFVYLAIATFFLIVAANVFDIRHAVQRVLASNYAQQLFGSHQGDLPIPTPIVAQASKIPVKTESVNYGQINNQKLVGYLARPADQNQPLPALIVIHEWWGLNDNIKAMTQRLAGEGYMALAVDLYQGKVAEEPSTARKLVTEAMANSSVLEDNIREAYNYLQQQEQAPKIGSIGWCFGGSWSLKTALLLPQQLDATVIYYGGNLETDPKVLKPLQMPILGIFGALDQNPSVSQVKQFQQSLESLNKSVEIHIYENADHAFANPSGTRYNRTAAEDAWQKTLAFLATTLKN